jgi:gliding motility-associated-like protein
MKNIVLLISVFIIRISFSQICDPSGNLMIYSNYDGGIVTINVDQNIPNLKIGICTYEPVAVTITGPFVGNVTQVIYAGFNSNQNNNNCGLGNFPTTITGVPAGIITINPQNSPPAVGYTPAHGNGAGPWGGLMIASAGLCDTTVSAGGGNTPDEIVYFFETQTGGSLLAHCTQYACWLNQTYNLSAGGTCCIEPSTSSNSVSCNPGGNVMIYSNYQGGPLTINVDENIPNLKIGICTYEATAVTFVGPFVSNITEVVYAGFDAPNNTGCGPTIASTTITGVPLGIVSMYSGSAGNNAIANYLGEEIVPGVPLVNCIVGAGGCTTSNAGGGNSSNQIALFFLAEFGAGSILYGHETDYSCFNSTPYNLSNGGNCCLETPTTPPNPIYTTGGANYDFIPQTTYSLCGGPLNIDLSSYAVLYQPPTYSGYVWSNGTIGPNITITTPGTYSFTVGDYCHFGSSALTDTIIVTPCCIPPPNPTGTVTSQPTCTLLTGTITISNPVGSQYEYSIDGINYQSSPIFGGLSPGTYSVVVRELPSLCESLIPLLLTISSAPGPTISTISVSDPSCNSGTNGLIVVSISGGTGPGTYTTNWTPIIGVINNNAGGSALSDVPNGSYTVTVTDQNNCTTSQNYVLNNPPPINLVETITNPFCNGTPGNINVIASGNSPFTYNWSNGVAASSTSITSPGSISLTVNDASNCVLTETYTTSLQGNLVLASVPNNAVILAGDSIQITANGAENFIWSPNASLSCSNCADPIAFPSQTTTYTLTGTNANTCSGSTLITITVIEDCKDIYVPTIFSPDGVGNLENDKCCVYGTCIQNLNYQIFDRWGKLLFEATDDNRCWDGTYKETPMNAGVYVYKLNVTLNNGKKIIESGNITLIR